MSDNINNTDIYVDIIENNLQLIKGELYKLIHDNRKQSGKEVRKAIMNIMKICRPFRAKVMDIMNNIKPRARWSKESIESMLKKKKETLMKKQKEHEILRKKHDTIKRKSNKKSKK